ncbi:MAG: transposase [Kribbellaceae bacterium]
MYLTYASAHGYALIDRPCTCRGLGRRHRAPRGRGVPDEVECATKPALAREMITRALDHLDSGASAPWVVGDEVYGADPGLRRELECRGVGYLLAVASSHHVTAITGSTSNSAASCAPTRS